MTPEQRRQAWTSMSSGRDDLYGMDLGRSAARDSGARRPALWERALDTAASLVLVTAVGVLGALVSRGPSWTSEDGEDT